MPRLGDLRADHHRRRGGALSDELFGFGRQRAWTIAFGALAAALALLGPVGFVRRFLRRFAVWVVLASLAYLTWWALDGADRRRALVTHGRGRDRRSGSAIDLVIAITVSWVPLVADYTRFRADRAGAFWSAPAVGYFMGATWMLALGVFIVLARGVADPGRRAGGRRRGRVSQRRSPCSPSRSTRRTRPSRTSTRRRSRRRTSSQRPRSVS